MLNVLPDETGNMERQGKHYRSKEEAGIIAYLLGTLTEIESDHFEQRYLEDAALFEEMHEIEDELIDDYAGGALTKEDRIRFEQHFLQSPDRREKVRFAMAITERAVSLRNERERGASPTPLVMPQPSVMTSAEEGQVRGKLLPFRRLLRPVPAWREWGAIAAAVLIAIGAGELWLRNRDLNRELLADNSSETRLREQAKLESARVEEDQTRLEAEKQRSNGLETQVQNLSDQVRALSEQASRTTKSVVNIFMGLGYFTRITRGGTEGKVMTVRVPRKADSLRFKLEFEQSEFHEFKVALLRTDGSTSWATTSNLKAQTIAGKQRLALTIPADQLVSGDYKLVVTSGNNQEPVGRYSLKVVRF